jgi:hypothetical protein
MIWIDIKAAQEAAQQTAQIILPPTAPALPEEQAWQMIYAEGGALALIACIAAFFLWKAFSRISEETRAQNKELINAQMSSISKLSEAVSKVETAVRMSDLNNTHAIEKLSTTVATTVARLDRHESKIEQHHESILAHSSRLSTLESRRTPPSSPVPAH